MSTPWLRLALESKRAALDYLELAPPGPLRELVQHHVAVLDAAIDTLRADRGAA